MGGKTPDTAAAKQLARLSTSTFYQSNPARKELFKQLNEALTTGGIGARIPIIQRAVGDVNAATAQSANALQGQQARAGFAGSPVGIQQLAQLRMQGSQAAARIPTDYAQQLIAGAPGLVTSATGIPGLASAASLLTGASAQGQATQAGLYGQGGSALGSLLGQIGYKGGVGGGFTFGPQG